MEFTGKAQHLYPKAATGHIKKSNQKIVVMNKFHLRGFMNRPILGHGSFNCF
jgi:hypothetical protein